MFLSFLCLSKVTGQEYVAGEVYQANYVEYRAGNLPIIISVPHGGLLEPDSIPDRDCAGCVTVMDAFTKTIGEDWYEALVAETGCYPHVIVNTLHRKKFDANRDLGDAADGEASVEQAWYTYHQYIDSAKARVVEEFGKGLFLDLHGHGHTIQRTELGYLLSKSELQMDDEELNTQGLIAESSLRTLVMTNSNSLSHSALIRGATSFGSLLEGEGFPSVPSLMDPFPMEDEDYFSGGYNTARHGSRDDNGPIDAIQIELNQEARFTESARAALVEAMTGTLLEYLELHYFKGFSDGYCNFVSSNQNLVVLNDVGVFPNPSEDLLWFKGIDNPVNVEVYSVQGKFVIIESLSSSSNFIKVDNLLPRPYIIKISGQGYEKTHQVLFIKE